MKMELNTAEVLAAFDTAPGQVAYATMLALNRTADTIKAELQWEMNRVFDKPTPWFLNSIRPSYATKTKLVAEIGYYWKAKDRSENGDASRSMVEPHVYGGSRHYKAMEVRLFKSGLLPEGWNVVPGGAANLDAFGNMSQGQITQILNVLQTYTEAGYNTANSKTIDRLAKGSKKKGTYGFTYWVNPPPTSQPAKGKHLPPGVYQRVYSGFGTSLKPVLIFVKRAAYKARLDFWGISKRAAERDMANNFKDALDQAMSTALLKSQGSLL
ncbi:MAG: hypothetical protein LAD29_09270 [Rhodoferax sp.]|nr:hypothetical protein [Rhodoferax sp.]